MRAIHFFLAVCLCTIALCPLDVTAQNTTSRDSLSRIIRNLETSDTSKILAEISIAEYYRFVNIDSAVMYLDRSIASSEIINFTKGQALAWNVKGLLSKDQRETDQAVSEFNKAIGLMMSNGDSISVANVYNNLGLVWSDVSNKTEAEKNFSRALQIYQRHKNLKGMGNVYVNSGHLYRVQGLFFTALDYYFKALAIFENNNFSQDQLATTYANLAVVYKQLEKYKEAILYQKKAIAIFDKLGLTLKVKVTEVNMANAYLEINQPDEAERLGMAAMEYFRANKRSRAVMACELILIQVAEKNKDFDKAYALAEDAYQLATAVKDPEAEATVLTNMAEIQFNKKNFQQAKLFAAKAVAISRDNNLLESEKDATEQQSKILISMGNFREGYGAYVRFTALKDSTFNKGKLSRLFELEKKYEIDKKQSEVDLLASKNRITAVELASERRSRFQLIIVSVLLLILAVVTYFAYRTKSRLSVRLAQQNDLIDSINKDLQARALRAQMNPHFIFNSLSSIQYLIIKNKSESAFDYLSQFSTLLRMVMDNSEKSWIKLSEETKVLTLYLELEKLRFNNSFNYSIECQPGLDNAKILPLLIQPYVENAIVHGLLPKEGDRNLKVTFSGDTTVVVCTVDDNGIGRAAAGKIAKEKNRLFASKGMNYSEGRMKVVNAIIGGDSKIEIIDLMNNGTATGTQVRITINQP